MPVTNWLGIFKRALGIKPGNPKEVREHIAQSIKVANRGRFNPDDNLGRTEEVAGRDDEGDFYYAPKSKVSWIYVTSSNVHSARWVGGDFPMQVRFHNGLWWYGYAVTYDIYKQFLSAPSKGQFIWYLRLGLKSQYRRYFPATIPPKILYPWGAIGSPPS